MSIPLSDTEISSNQLFIISFMAQQIRQSLHILKIVFISSYHNFAVLCIFHPRRGGRFKGTLIFSPIIIIGCWKTDQVRRIVRLALY